MFEKRAGKVFVRFPVSLDRTEWRSTEVRLE
jgi:hypothetical protein